MACTGFNRALGPTGRPAIASAAATRTHFPITVSGSNPCPDRGFSATARATWSERQSKTASTSSSRVPTYGLISER